MLENVGWAEILVLLLAALFILGPERLPEAASWLAKSMRKVRDFATGAKDQLRNELGPEYDELRKPLEDIQRLRGLNPRSMVTRQLFGEDNDRPFAQEGDDLRREAEDFRSTVNQARPTSGGAAGSRPAAGPGRQAPGGSTPGGAGRPEASAGGASAGGAPERPSYDVDAT